MNQDFIEALDQATKIVVIQGENPDGDSLSSSLALEHIFGDLGKELVLYCAVGVAKHLRYLPGWDRVTDELPNQFDLSVVVDTVSASLLEKTFSDSQQPLLRARPMVLIDHHDVEVDMPFHTINVIDPQAVATGELIYNLAQQQNWPINDEAKEMLAVSIMYDSLGLSTEATTARSIRVVADLVEAGVSLAKLDNQRRAMMKRPLEITRYKGELLGRIELSADNQLATIHIPWEEIQTYSDKYNPSILVLDEMRLVEDVKIAIAYKTYPDGKLTAKIRCNFGSPIANRLAEQFGGGGHEYSAGFKVIDQPLETIQAQVIKAVTELLHE